MGEDVRCEMASCLGRSDIVVKTDEFIYLFEIKYSTQHTDSLLEEAMNQIDTKGYLIPYLNSNLKTVKIAAVFIIHKQ